MDKNIPWQYIDKRAATINALKDYESMKYILQQTKEEIASAQERMTSIGSAALSDLPKGKRNPHAGEDRIVKAMDAIDILRERSRRAVAFMDWFQPAWNGLGEEEQFVLRHFFMEDATLQTDSVYEICERYHIERTSAYKKKDRALAHLALLLYGI